MTTDPINRSGKKFSLLTSIFPKDLLVVDSEIGGPYNRVVGGILHHNSTDPMSVILWIPRFDHLQPADEVVALRCLTEITT